MLPRLESRLLDAGRLLMLHAHDGVNGSMVVKSQVASLQNQTSRSSASTAGLPHSPSQYLGDCQDAHRVDGLAHPLLYALLAHLQLID